MPSERIKSFLELAKWLKSRQQTPTGYQPPAGPLSENGREQKPAAVGSPSLEAGPAKPSPSQSIDLVKRLWSNPVTQLVGSFLLVLFGASLAGSIVRGELSPWVWEELRNAKFAPSFANQVVGIVWYMAFYSMGFLVPFWATTFALFLGRLHTVGPMRMGASALDSVPGRAATTDVPPMPPSHRAGRRYLSLSTLVLFLLLLDPIVAFVRALPTAWNGWLLLLGLGAAAFLALAAYVMFREGL